MKAKRTRVACAAVCLSLLLTGCGIGTPLIELSEEEEDIITMYAAKVVAKHNVRLGQGLVRYKDTGEEEETGASEDDKADDTETTDTASATDGSGETADDTSESDVASVSLTDAMGISGIAFAYDRAEFAEDLVFSNYYHLQPSDGSEYLILHFKASNATSVALDVDVYSMQPVFSATLAGESYGAENTILPNDLATYVGSIGAGDDEELILLFEIPATTKEDVDAIGLQMKLDGKTYQIAL